MSWCGGCGGSGGRRCTTSGRGDHHRGGCSLQEGVFGQRRPLQPLAGVLGPLMGVVPHKRAIVSDCRHTTHDRCSSGLYVYLASTQWIVRVLGFNPRGKRGIPMASSNTNTS
jgi:hypothetical protein